MRVARVWTYLFLLPDSDKLDVPLDGLYGCRVVACNEDDAKRRGKRMAEGMCMEPVAEVGVAVGCAKPNDYHGFALERGVVKPTHVDAA